MRIVETPVFSRRVAELLSDDEYRVLQLRLLHSPETGRVIVRTGGARKVRWALPRTGKSRGVRVIYYYAAADGVIYMLAAYAKTEQRDLTSSQKNALRMIIAGFVGLTGLASRLDTVSRANLHA
ncbi:MAG: hypothetical protein AVDCRST_MAG68-2857 [uncultured Gemmatimonadetes bacterium]|uniref:Addiction module toxin RelE n=1 Tax=uncultured Gemmatimonadota bacterium TaxID=203437 RepID=A0A6J4LR27_9BACT|nr:MAG: hypothetical protein AVDCRST_MAG68-2857 [uncultured Gemmatimonadota bacterium]